MKRKRALVLLCITLFAAFSGCGQQTAKPEKIKDLEYTVQEAGELPEELFAKITEKQKDGFTMSYQTEGYLYLAKGYGAQGTSGYSIRVMDLYESAEGIVFSCELLGPEKTEPVLQTETYPYIVVKLQDIGIELWTGDSADTINSKLE